MAGYSLGFAHGRITLTYNGGPAMAQLQADLLRVIALAGRAHRSLEEFGKRTRKMEKGLLTAAKAVGSAAAKVGGLVQALLLVSTVAAQLTPIFIAAFAVIPGLVLGAAAAFGLVKVATLGMGDALKAASEDADKFNEAIKKLPPQAQAFARAYRDAGKSLGPVQKAIQNAFFNQTGPEISKIAKNLAGVRSEAVGAADGFNRVFRRVLEFASSSTAIDTVKSALVGVRNFMLGVEKGVQPLLKGFFSLGRQAFQFAGVLGGSLGAALMSFGQTLEHTDLVSVFSKAMDAIQPFITVGGQLASVISSIFTGLQVDGGGALGVLGQIIGQLDLFLKTAEGQEALASLGQALNAIATATGQVFLTLLQELTPVIVALAPSITQLASAVADLLVPALQVVGPILAGIASFLSDNDLAAPLILGIYGLVAAMRVYSAATAAAATITGIMNSAQATAAIAWIRSTAAIVASSVATAYNTVVTKIAAAGTAIWTGIQWLFNAALVANPIGIIIVAIIALVGIIIVIATKTTWFQTIWEYTWGAIKTAAAAVGNWFANTLWPLIKSVWDNIVNFIKFNVQAIVIAFKAIWNAILAVIGFFENLRNGVLQKVGALISYLRGIGGIILDALGNLGSLLYEKGKTLVEGFINGIKAMFGKLKDTAASLAKTVTDFLPGSPAKKGPLSKRGWTPFRGASLVKGLEDGMKSQLDTLAKVSAQVALTAVPFLPMVAGGAGVSVPLSATAQTAAAQSGSGLTVNQTVNALPGMNAKQVADYANRRLILGIRTGSTVVVPNPAPANDSDTSGA